MFNHGRVVPEAQFAAWIAHSSRSTRPRRRPCPRTRRPTSRTQTGGPDERDRSVGACPPKRLAKADRLQHADRRRARDRRLVPRSPHRRSLHRRRSSPTTPTQARTTSRSSSATSSASSASSSAWALPTTRSSGCSDIPPALAEHEAEAEGVFRYFTMSHRPQGRRQAVHGGDRRVLLRRRPQRDAHPDRAAAAQRARVRRQPVPDAGRDARVDDDGDHDLGIARPVCAVVRPADDRFPADGVPARSRRSPSGC